MNDDTTSLQMPVPQWMQNCQDWGYVSRVGSEDAGSTDNTFFAADEAASSGLAYGTDDASTPFHLDPSPDSPVDFHFSVSDARQLLYASTPDQLCNGAAGRDERSW
jgi:hypothetical protein